MSVDTLESHRSFATAQGLNFPLISDADLSISKKFGVKDMNGFLPRVTFVIGADGKIAHVFPKVNPRGHADEVLAVLQQEQSDG